MHRRSSTENKADADPKNIPQAIETLISCQQDSVLSPDKRYQEN